MILILCISRIKLMVGQFLVLKEITGKENRLCELCDISKILGSTYYKMNCIFLLFRIKVCTIWWVPSIPFYVQNKVFCFPTFSQKTIISREFSIFWIWKPGIMHECSLGLATLFTVRCLQFYTEDMFKYNLYTLKMHYYNTVCCCVKVKCTH